MSAYDDMKTYYEQVGMFVTIFSEVELRLLQSLWHFSGLKQPVASAVLTGTKVEGAMSLINRIADAEDWSAERRAELQYIFSQLGEINKLRNDLLHFGSFWEHEKDEWAISNEGFVHASDRLRRRVVSIATWNDAFADLLKIFHALRVIAWPDQISSKDREIYSQDRSRAWRYKPQQQIARGQKTPRTHQKQ